MTNETKHTDARLASLDNIRFSSLVVRAGGGGERRDVSSRVSLRKRIQNEFQEMPGTSLTLAQATRLFGVHSEACRRIFISLVEEGQLYVTNDGRYRLRTAAA